MFGESIHRSNCFMTPNDFGENLKSKLNEIKTEQIIIEEEFKESTAKRIKEFINAWVL